MNIRHNGSVVGVALLLLTTGCSGPKLMEVSGKVTYKGQPVPSTRVCFQPDSGSRPSIGITDDSGKFQMSYSRAQWGVTPGPHTVCLSYVVGADEERGRVPPKASREVKTVILRYGDPKKSSLHYDVNKNGEVFNIDLQ
jgi:hypothetical protein